MAVFGVFWPFYGLEKRAKNPQKSRAGCGAPAVQDMLAGTLPSIFIDFVTAQSLIRAGKLRPLAVSTPKRISTLAELPTFVEQGFPEFVASAFQGVVVPAGTPRDIVMRLNRELVAAINSPEISKRLADMGVEPATSTPEQMVELLKSETARWRGIIQSRGISLEL